MRATFKQLIGDCWLSIPSATLHNSDYDFNDDALRYGTEYFITLARDRLPPPDA